MAESTEEVYKRLHEKKRGTEAERIVLNIIGVVNKNQNELNKALSLSIENLLKEPSDWFLNERKISEEQVNIALLEEIISISNVAMSQAFLKTAFGSFLEHYPEKLKKDRNFSLKKFFIGLLQREKGSEFLMEVVQKELEIFFRGIKVKESGDTDQLGKIWALLYDPKSILAIVFESTKFFERSPEQFPGAEGWSDTSYQKFGTYINAISEFFSMIENALKITLRIEKDSTPKYTGKDINNVSSVPAFYIEYIENVMSGPQQRNFNQQYIDTIHRVINEVDQNKDIELSQDISISVIIKRKGGSKAHEATYFPRSGTLMISPSGFFYSGKDQALDKQAAEGVEEPWLLIEAGTDVPQTVLRRTRCVNFNSFLAFLRRGPLVKMTLGLGANSAFTQFFTVYPKIYDQVTPYFIMFDMLGVTIALLDGRQAVLYPNREPIPFFRVAEAVSEALMVFVFMLGGVIETYLYYNPDVDYISNLEFYTQFVSGPLALSILYILFYSKPNAISQGEGYAQDLKVGLHVFFSFLLFGSIFQNSMLNFLKESNHGSYLLYDLMIPVSASLISTYVRIFTPYGESARSLFSYLSLANFAYMLYEKSLGMDNSASFGNLSYYGRVALYTAASFGSLIFMYRQARAGEFLPNFYDKGELITRMVTAEGIGDTIVQDFGSDTLEGTLDLPLLSRRDTTELSSSEIISSEADQKDIVERLIVVRADFNDGDKKENTLGGGPPILTQRNQQIAQGGGLSLNGPKDTRRPKKNWWSIG